MAAVAYSLEVSPRHFRICLPPETHWIRASSSDPYVLAELDVNNGKQSTKVVLEAETANALDRGRACLEQTLPWAAPRRRENGTRELWLGYRRPGSYGIERSISNYQADLTEALDALLHSGLYTHRVEVLARTGLTAISRSGEKCVVMRNGVIIGEQG